MGEGSRNGRKRVKQDDNTLSLEGFGVLVCGAQEIYLDFGSG